MEPNKDSNLLFVKEEKKERRILLDTVDLFLINPILKQRKKDLEVSCSCCEFSQTLLGISLSKSSKSLFFFFFSISLSRNNG